MMSLEEFNGMVFFAVGIHTAGLVKSGLVENFDTNDLIPKISETLPEFYKFDAKNTDSEVDANAIRFYHKKLIEWYGV